MKNPFEAGPERIPTKEEVMGIIARHAENATFVLERTDEQGIYYLEARCPGEKPGEFNEYTYTRKGAFPGAKHGNQARISTITIVYYDKDGVPVSGTQIADYNHSSQQWEELK